jgi:phenylacetate-CoA ligase
MTERQVQLIADFCPDIIMVTPSYLLAIADEFTRQKLDARRCSLKVGILGAEPWTEAMRGEIEACFDLDALDIYGLSEVIGPGVSCECIESKDGLHVWEDHFYPEVVDPVTGEVLPDGRRGELVLTSLTKEAMPVVRYRTRDLTRLLPGTARSMRRMEKITGRSDDMLIVRGVNLFPSAVDQVVRSVPGVAEYRVEIDTAGALVELELIVEPVAVGATGADTRDLCAALEDAFRATYNLRVPVRAVQPGELPRFELKSRRWIKRAKITP